MIIRKACPKKKRKHRKEKQLLSGLSLLLIVCILSNVGIAALYPQLVYASFAGTVAGYILTLFASFNTAITNPNVVTAINNTFGSMALEAADAGVIDQGIAQIASTTGFDMASIFSNTAAEAEQVIAAGWDTISTTAQTAGENIQAGAQACFALGGAVLPAIGGTVLPAAGAVGAGIGLGILIDKARTALTNYIKNGIKLDTRYASNPSIPVGSSIAVNAQNSVVWVENGYVWSAGNSYGGQAQIAFYGPGVCRYGYIQGHNGDQRTYSQNYPVNAVWLSSFPSFSGDYFYNNSNIQTFPTNSDGENYYRSLYNQGLRPDGTKISPDIIGDIGNQTGVTDNGNYTLPYITNIYDYGNTVINYIDPSDYQDFVDRANDNTDNGDTGEDIQGQDFDDFVDPYITPIEVDQPTDPDQPIPQPTIAPVQPDIPVQPTPAPEPTLTPEETEEMPRGMVQPSLKDKFPFCIPFDIGYLLNKMSAEREAPRFVWQLDFGQWGQYTITVDLSPFDSVAAILRTLELILFILGLMLATKSLMSTSDGG